MLCTSRMSRTVGLGDGGDGEGGGDGAGSGVGGGFGGCVRLGDDGDGGDRLPSTATRSCC